MGWKSPGRVRYRAPYGANKISISDRVHMDKRLLSNICFQQTLGWNYDAKDVSPLTRLLRKTVLCYNRLMQHIFMIIWSIWCNLWTYLCTHPDTVNSAVFRAIQRTQAPHDEAHYTLRPQLQVDFVLRAFGTFLCCLWYSVLANKFRHFHFCCSQ